MTIIREKVSFTYVIESIDSKLISVCIINDYLLIADLHIFVYGNAECATISLEYTKVKLFILNNFCINPSFSNKSTGLLSETLLVSSID